MMWLFWVLFIISLIANVIFVIGLRNLFRKVDLYEDSYLDTKRKLNQLLTDIEYIDDMQLFEKDDYVGATFDGIKSLIQKYNEEI